MKAAVFKGPGVLSVEEVSEPSLGPLDALIRVHRCGLCGTDSHIWQGVFPIDGLPRVLGHEFSGEIADVATPTRGLTPGTRVVVDINIGCGSCVYCQRGRRLQCSYLRQIGVHFDGAFAEFVKVPVDAIRVIPSDMSYETAALVEPLSCTLHGQERVAIQPGEVVVVLGSGPMGLLHCMVSRLRGASVIVASEVNELRRGFALAAGADRSVGGSLEEIKQALFEATGFEGADVVIESAGVAATYKSALQLARPGGRVLFFGAAPTGTELMIEPFDVYRRELSLLGSYAGSYGSWPDAIALLHAERLPVKDLVTNVVPLEELQNVLDAMPTDPSTIKVQVALS
ncbi:MAG TPA: alcohol dehydrogenase catalytic domain-containing protein [Acidimicrobiales bacterium]|jgi:threonine dehydrogenase-like Zn-dependent dehydrogenase